MVDKKRWAALLCAYFIRNLASFRELKKKQEEGIIPQSSYRFWYSTYGNCIDMCILEWCKLFGGKNEEHYWEKVTNKPLDFLLQKLSITQDEWDKYVKEMRQQRDTFVAHQDQENEMYIPHMDLAYKSVCLYYEHIFPHVKNTDNIPNDMVAFYKDCQNEVSEIFHVFQLSPVT